MKSVYVTSVERYSGKTAVCLGLGLHFKQEGMKVAYLKPLSVQPWRVEGHVADEDAGFVKEVLGLDAPPWELSPVVVTPEYLRVQLDTHAELNLMDKVKEAAQKTGAGQDVLLLEGGGSMREGYVVGLPTPVVATELSSSVIMIVRYRDEVRVLDDALAAKRRLGENLAGLLINRVHPESVDFVRDSAIPFLEARGIPVFGALPEVRGLAALSVDELIDLLDAEVLTAGTRKSTLIESLTVGAMTAEAALKRFRKQQNKAVITGGDRTDIQLAALETSTACLVLTGNLRPSPLVVRQAEEFGVPVLLVSSNTMETVELIDRVYGKNRLGHAAKLQQFRDLLDQHVNYKRLYEELELNQ